MCMCVCVCASLSTPDTSVELGVRSGVVVAVPVPEELERDTTAVEEAIQLTLANAE